MNTQLKDDKKTITIKEAIGFPEGTPIPRITGTLTHVFDRKTGEGDYGPYSSQSGVIEQDGSKILFTVWNKPTIPEDYKGRLLVFRSGTGKKPSMSLKSDFKDATKRVLNVTKSCHVLTEEEDTDDIPFNYPGENKPENRQATEAPRTTPQAPVSQPKANVEPKKAIPVDGVQAVRKRVMQLANLREICDHAAGFLYPDGDKDFVKEIATSLFIQATRENLHDKLPNNKPISKKEEVGASEPEMAEKDVEF